MDLNRGYKTKAIRIKMAINIIIKDKKMGVIIMQY